MNRASMFFIVIFALTSLGAVLLLTLAIWPGLLGDVVFGFPLLIVFLPLLGIWFLMLVALAVFDLQGGWQPTNRRRWGLWSATVMFATLALLSLHVPERIGIAGTYVEFDGLAHGLLAKHPVEIAKGTRVGPYVIEDYAEDERGGVYFRTHIGPDGIGPDTMSYGFVYQPNSKGSPFGNAGYRFRKLFGDWYAFAVSDDW